MAPQGSAYGTDWILSNTSSAHVANHRDWFTTFTEFPSSIASMPGGPPNVEVRGVGTVVLETRTRRKPQTITLENVLYVPDCTTNIFAYCEQDEYTVNWPGGDSSIRTSTGKIVGLIVKGKLMRIWLKGLSETQSSLDSNGVYYIHATWPESERARWEAHRRTNESAASASNANGNSSATLPPLTDVEKKFLKDNYGNEFKFLLQHGLRIHDDKQRAEGRDVLKAMMAADDNVDDDDESGDESEDSGERFLRDLEEDPMSHVADYQFSEKQLDWIDKHYRHSGQFMLSYGLKPFDDEDCKEAASIVESMM